MLLDCIVNVGFSCVCIFIYLLICVMLICVCVFCDCFECVVKSVKILFVVCLL